MTNQRRQYLKAAGALGAMAFLPGIPQAMAQESKLKASADAILKAATDAGDVPGVVAMATNRASKPSAFPSLGGGCGHCAPASGFTTILRRQLQLLN
jgi:hypothetical protein